MKALLIDEPGKTRITEIPKPEIASDGVLLKVAYVGYCGSDLNTYRGKNPMVKFPRIPGHEVSAVIEAVGAAVPDQWQPGTNVTISPYTNCGKCAACLHGRPNCCQFNETMGVQRDGAMTEYVTVPHSKLFAADKLSLKELALVEPLTVGGHAVDRAAPCNGDTLVVLGCGMIGLGAVSAAAAMGVKVIAVDIDDEKLAIAREAGASEVINSAEDDFHEAVLARNDRQAPNVIIEAIGLPVTFRMAVDEVAFAGTVVYIGYAKQPVEYETKYFVQKELDIRGSRNAMPGNFEKVIGMLGTGSFPIDKVVSRIVPLEDAGKALEEWDSNPAAITKILVKF